MNFNTDEKIIINSMVANQNVNELTLENLKESLAFSLEVSNEEMKPLMEGLFDKLNNGNSDEFNHMKLLMPFDVPYDFDSNVDVVPFNENE